MRDFVRRLLNFKSTFPKLLISYIILTSLILTVSTLVLYRGYKEQMIEQARNTSIKLANQADFYTKNTLNWAKSFAYQLYLDKDVYRLMFEPEADSEQAKTAVAKISQMPSLVTNIQSVYVYNNVTKTLYSSSGNSASYTEFNDQGIIAILRNAKENFSASLIPRRITLLSDNVKRDKNVLTVVLSNSKASDTDLPDGAIILNLDADNVANYFQTTIADTSGNLFALDSLGKIVFHSNPDLFLADFSARPYVKQLINSNKPSDSFLTKIDGKQAIVSYVTSQRLGLRFVNIAYSDVILGTINRIVSLLIMVFAFAFIVGLIYAFVLAKRFYLPIERTVRYVKKLMPAGEDTTGQLENELDFLQTAIDKILNQPLTLEKMSKPDIDFVRHQLLKGLLLNTPSHVQNLKGKLEELDVNIDLSKTLVVALLRIDSYRQFIRSNPEERTNLVESDILYTVKSQIQRFENEAFIMGEGTIALVLNLPNPDHPHVMDEILEYLAKVQESIYTRLKVSVSAGVGSFARSVSAVYQSYRTAEDCLNYRFKYGRQALLWPEKIQAEINEDYKYPEGIEQILFNDLKLGNLEKIESELDRIFTAIAQYSYSDMLLAITQLAENSKKVINSLLELSHKKAIDVRDFRQKLSQMETIDEARNWFFDLYRGAIEKRREKKSNRKTEVVESVQKYIEEDYSDPLLSLESLAERLNISPNYLRLIFKEAVNKSLSAYLAEFRFDKAKTLLETTNLTIAETANKVGYANSNYFYTAFKKHYGVSPNQYRNVKSGEREAESEKTF